MMVFASFYEFWKPRYSTNRSFLSLFDTVPLDILSNNSASRGGRRMGIPPSDLSRRAGSNGGIPALLPPLEAELFDKMSNGAVSRNDKIPIVDISLNISVPRGGRRMKIPPFEPAR